MQHIKKNATKSEFGCSPVLGPDDATSFGEDGIWNVPSVCRQFLEFDVDAANLSLS